MEKREIRTMDCHLAVREAEQGGGVRTIYGTAIVFDRESVVLDDWGEKFREIIRPEACTMEWLNTQDVKLNLLHERGNTIARCDKGALGSSLRLSVDDEGVHFEADVPDCDLGQRAEALVRAGVYSGCSFEFVPKDYEVIREGDDVTIVHHSFELLSALTIGMDPAYRQTSVNVREAKGAGEPEEPVQEEPSEQPDTEAEAAREAQARRHAQIKRQLRYD